MSDQGPPSTPDDGSFTPPPSSPPPSEPPPGSTPPAPPPPASQPGQVPTASMPGLGMRFLGRLIDAFVVGIPMAILFAIVPGIAVGGLLYNIVVSIAGFAYFVFMESSSGATVGKKLLNMRVVDASGGLLSTEASARRNWWLLIGLLGGIPVIGFLASLASLAVVIYIAVTISGDPNNRGWHDQLADAGVVPA